MRDRGNLIQGLDTPPVSVSSSQGYRKTVGSGLCILIPRGES